MQRLLLSLPGCRFMGRGAHRGRAHPAAAPGAAAAAHQPYAEGAVRRGGVRTAGGGAVLSKLQIWTRTLMRTRCKQATELLHTTMVLHD